MGSHSRDRANSERGVDDVQMFRRALSRIFTDLDDSSLRLKGSIRDDIKKNLATMSEIFEGLLCEYIKSEDQVEEFQKEIEHRNKEEKTSKPLYSEVNKRRIPKKEDTAVLVYPSKGMEALEPRKLLEKVKKEVDLQDLGVSVKTVRTVRSGVVITCCTSSGALKLQKKLQEQKDYEIRQTTRRRPRIIVTRAPLDISAEALRSNIKIFNEHIKGELFSPANFKPVFQVGKWADRNLCSWGVEVDLRTQRAISESNDFLSIGWSSHKIRDFYNFCAKQCKSDVVCLNCAETGHDSSQCTARREEFKCTNCLKYNEGCHQQSSQVDPSHGAHDWSCPFFRYQFQLADRYTQH